MSVVQYFISDGINCLFELPLETATTLLPKGLQPIESNHGVGLLGITLFNFTESPVGPYQELVFSIYIVPRTGLTGPHPHAAVYPLVVASSSEAARQHAIDLWHLPHFMEDIHLEFIQHADTKSITGKVMCSQQEPIVELTISQGAPWKPIQQFYQSFQNDSSGSYIGILDMKGSLSEHEENTGTLNLHSGHHFFSTMDFATLDPLPYREMWMKDGVESYHQLLSFPNT